MDGAVVDCLPDGTEVALSAESRAGWRQVSGRGWVVGEYLRQSGGVVRGTDSCVNVRDMPSTAGRVVGCVSEGHSLAIVEGPVAGEPGSWLRVAANPEATEGGWVLADYVD